MMLASNIPIKSKEDVIKTARYYLHNVDDYTILWYNCFAK